MIIPRNDKPYFYPPFFDISCFWQESTGLSHKIRVYIPFETTMTFTPFLGVMVNRKQFEYFTIEDNPMRKPNAKLLSDEDAEGNCYDWYTIDKHNRIIDRTPPLKETEVMMLELAADYEARLCNLELGV